MYVHQHRTTLDLSSRDCELLFRVLVAHIHALTRTLRADDRPPLLAPDAERMREDIRASAVIAGQLPSTLERLEQRS